MSNILHVKNGNSIVEVKLYDTLNDVNNNGIAIKDIDGKIKYAQYGNLDEINGSGLFCKIGNGFYKILKEAKFKSFLLPEDCTWYMKNTYNSTYKAIREYPDNIKTLDARNTTKTNYMFGDCNLLKTIPKIINTSKITSASSMFYNCNNVTTIPELNTSSFQDMSLMFRYCNALKNFTWDIDMTSCTNFLLMFQGCVPDNEVRFKNVPKELDLKNPRMKVYLALERYVVLNEI